jgi:hypothetical protein
MEQHFVVSVAFADFIGDDGVKAGKRSLFGLLMCRGGVLEGF